MIKIIKKIIQWYYRIFPLKSVKYYHFKETERAYITQLNGYLQMVIDGEDYIYPGFPRGHLLSSALYKLKHIAKNQFFNETWAELEAGKSEEEIIKRLKSVVEELGKVTEENKYFMVSPNKFVPALKELWRAFTVIERKLSKERAERLYGLKRCLTFILQEDDAYRFRFQFMAGFFNPNVWWKRLLRRDPIKDFESALTFLEHAETLEDMKGKIRLLRRVLLFILGDKGIKGLFEMLCKEVDWNKLKLTKADKYYLRAKYFKADYKSPNTFLGRISNEVLY